MAEKEIKVEKLVEVIYQIAQGKYIELAEIHGFIC